MSKIQLSELSQNTSELEVLNEQETTDVIGGDVYNHQSNGAGVGQGAGKYGINISYIDQVNYAENVNYESYKTVYKLPWYYHY